MRHPSGIVTLGLLIVLGTLAGPGGAEPPGIPGPPRVYALERAHIVPAPGERIDSGTVVIRDGLIEAVGADVASPPDAVVIDAEGLWVYPGLIDAAIDLTAKEKKKSPTASRRPARTRPEAGPRPGPVHALPKVHPEKRAVDDLVPFDGERRELLERYRELGFTTGLVAPRSGIFRGSSSVVLLRDDTPVSEMILLNGAAQHLAFERGRFGQGYPTSLMGAVATIRQVVLDARRHAVWAERHQAAPGGITRPDSVASFGALEPMVSGDQPAIFHVESPADVLLADRVSDELGLRGAVHGSGHEWEIADQIAAADRAMILPIAFPKKPEVSDDDAALDVTAREMRRYLEAPAAAARLHDAGVTFALTTNGLEKLSDLKKNVRKMMDAGLAEDVALAALTTVPARMVGLERMIGTLEAGKIANVVVLDGPIFDAETKRVFVDGREYRIRKKKQAKKGGDPDAKADGRAESRSEPAAGARADDPALAPETVLVTNATLWTQGPQGRLEDADLLVRAGMVVEVGTGLEAPEGAHVVDATGKHVTPGLIDTHGHLAIRGGGNEGSNNITAEVRIQDVINPEDIDIYRQLAGGLTCAHVLHGSANSIGGQDAVIKLHWGASADDLVIPGRKGIKFALGENPKQSRPGGGEGPARYPRTRMGVVESIRAAFLRARNYEREWEAYDTMTAGERERRKPPRRDLQLEAISEVLSGERAIHCHAYRQDEMLAVLRLAAEFDIPIATFEHGLEGYKIADELAAAGAGVTTFSDWWAYKVEAYDAIPYNGALMHDRGVLVTFNSDSAELARRMNLEAAKAVKYGGVDEEEALAFVTLNAARQLGLDDRVGSLEDGKDADFVIWSGDPLSVFSVVEQTWVDGKREFDREADLAQRLQVDSDRSALVSRIRSEKKDDSEDSADPEEDEEAPEVEDRPLGPRSPVEPRALPYRDRLAELGGAVSIVGATVHTMTGAPIENGTVSFEAGRIVAVGSGLPPLTGATVIDAAGRHLYPGLIDANNVVGLTEISAVAASVDIDEIGLVNANVNTAIAVNPDSELIPVTRANGITHVLVAPGGDLVRGTSALIRLDGWTWEDLTATTPVAMHLAWPSFAIQTASFFGPPPSREEQEQRREERLEKIRQVFADARAYATAREAAGAGGRRVDVDPVLDALRPVLDGEIPLIVHADEVRQIKSAVEWAGKEGVRMILAGSQDVGRVTDLLSARGIPVILTNVLGLPAREDEPYDTPYATAARLHEAGVAFCFAGAGSSFGASSARHLPYHAAMAAAFGLPREEALRALTLYPARILGVDDHLGSIEPGKSASLILTDGDPLEIRTQVTRVFIDGREVDVRDNRHDRLFRRYAARPVVE